MSNCTKREAEFWKGTQILRGISIVLRFCCVSRLTFPGRFALIELKKCPAFAGVGKGGVSMSKSVTLADVARAVGVAPSTVQRALSGAAGVSEEKSREIREVAQRMGYRRNAMATLLKSANRDIAVILPKRDYYSNELWDGVQQFFSENAGFGFALHKYTYQRTSEALAGALENAYADHGTRLCGVLTMGERLPGAQKIYQKWKTGHVPVVFVGTDTTSEDRLCCSLGYDDLAGKMAADLLLLAGKGEHIKILMTGDFSIADQYYNMQGFERVIMDQKTDCEIVKFNRRTTSLSVKETLSSYLTKDPAITTVYSTSARNTVAMCEAALESGRWEELRLIGNDLFPQSRQFLKDGVLNAVIHKLPKNQAYNAAQALVNFLVHGQRPADTVRCCPVVVTRSNCGLID